MIDESTLRSALAPVLAVVAVVAVIVVGASWMIGATPSGPDTGETASGPSADRAPRELVHLGDSFASGAGTSPLVADSPMLCQRSQQNFGELLAAARGLRLTDVSCAGATTEQLSTAQYDGVPPQLDALSPQTAYVTLMIGGNDGALFSTLVGQCTRLGRAEPGGDPCRRTLGRAPLRELSETTRPAVTEALREIRARAPHARIMLVGYPWLMPAHTACRPAVGIADGDVDYVNQVQAALDSMLLSAARTAGVAYVDMAAASTGHDACAPRGTRWIEPQIGGASRITMHPNAAGQRALADAVAAQLD